MSLSCGEFQVGCERTSGPASMSYHKSIIGRLKIGHEGELCQSVHAAGSAQTHTHTYVHPADLQHMA